MKYAIFGDTGGHLRQLTAGLVSVGWNPQTGLLPEGLTIVHCGDLIHKGPNSTGVLHLVNRIRTLNPGRWVQILGNHELNYVMDAPTFWRDGLDNEGLQVLGAWLREGFPQIAFGLPAGAKFEHLTVGAREYAVPSNGILFTHAGLTHGFWEDVLDREQDAVKAATMLNSLPTRIVTRAGSMLDGMPPEFLTGPVWASCADELWASWHQSEDAMPFSQVHGHTTSFNFSTGKWWGDFRAHQEASKTNPEKRRVMTRVAHDVLVAVDPGYSKTAAPGEQPSLMVEVQE